MATGGPGDLDDAGVLPTSTRGRWFVAAALGLALLLRVGVVVLISDGYVPLTDAEHFDEIATSMANGDGYGPYPIPPAEGTGAFRAPAYPFVLSLAYVIAGDHSYTVGLLQNAFIGTGLVALIGIVAAQLWSRRVGGVALLLAAAHPTLILVGSSLQLEPLLVASSLGAVAATLQHQRAPRGLRWPIVVGALVGLAILTRELGFVLIPSLAWILWAPGRDRDRPKRRRTLAAPVAMVVVAAVVVLPWTIRNAVRLDAFVPVSSSSGFGLAGTYNQTAMDQRAEWIPPYEDERLVEVMLAVEEPDEAALDRVLRSEAIDFGIEHPSYVPQVAFYGLMRLFDLDGGDYDRRNAVFLPYPPTLVWASVLATYPLLLAAAFGVRSPLRRRAPTALWAIPLLMVVQIAVLLPANVRYRASVEPYLLLLASLALAPAVERIARARGWWQAPQPHEGDRPS
jgi:4-amino-4-deoxy-L-arabinose transferase-like glycosyltransferase